LLFLQNQTNARILHSQLSRAGAVVVMAKDRDDFVRYLQPSEKNSPSIPRAGTTHSGIVFDAVVIDVASLERVRIFLLSLSQLPPLVVSATAVERESDLVRQMRAQYSPLLHVLHLPLRQARLLEEWRDVLACFEAGRSPSIPLRRGNTASHMI
jgi:CheY-like chemotaxis protein